MTAAPGTPHGMRDRLLQAIDGHSNEICNMVIVVEVISFLEKYPITKEALEETRLGKLINDVRKKTKNEDLAKRAKRLLRTWQKLISPGRSGVFSKSHNEASWASNSLVHPCIPKEATALTSGKAGLELKSRNDFNNCALLEANKPRNRRHTEEFQEGLSPAKISKLAFNDRSQKQLPNKRVYSSADISSDYLYPTEDEDFSDLKNSDKLLNVKSAKPHPSGRGFSMTLTAAKLQKTSFLQQQQARQTSSGGQHQPGITQDMLHVPESVRQGFAAPAQNICTSGLRISPQMLNDCIQGSQSPDVDFQSSSHCMEDNSAFTDARNKRCSFRFQDYVMKPDRPVQEDNNKPVRFKDGRLTFNPVTGQIQPSSNKNSSLADKAKLAHRVEPQCTEQPKHNPPVPLCLFQQTNWKELSRNEIIQSYFSQQSSMLSSSRVHSPSTHLFMTEYLKKDERQREEDKETHVLVSALPSSDIPGLSREVQSKDLRRLHTEQWPGVNGCHDTRGEWYKWTECISLDPHGDGSRLNILPYVCLDLNT
ncbi:mediator of RNA polymerase II transcription subunit 26-like [Phycodurus eques]|uniref:mediator of RNA polymerase II transcription subunit 26-like n=1 Tax=Phycodurus eques TaxID=693459 RepID=UPI002ACDDC9C|nr:mediator of RNA polymerase II transcription subunit 26-like [Phycodurus eques]